MRCRGPAQRLQYAKGKSDAVAQLEGASAKGKKSLSKQLAAGPAGAPSARSSLLAEPSPAFWLSATCGRRPRSQARRQQSGLRAML